MSNKNIMFIVTTYASNKNTSWTTFPLALAKFSKRELNFSAHTSSFAPTFAATMFKNAQSLCDVW